MLQIEPVTLEGEIVRLEPLDLTHAESLYEAGHYPEIWTYLSARISHRDEIEPYIEKALANRENGTELPFAIIDKQDGSAIGSTRYLNIAHKDHGLEIGHTWLTPRVWKTAVNTECKLLLLRHAFEALGCVRVQLKTDARNLNSQRAIARIGAVREGVLRKHMIMRDGYVRDTVMFSILDREWPDVQQHLLNILEGKSQSRL